MQLANEPFYYWEMSQSWPARLLTIERWAKIVQQAILLLWGEPFSLWNLQHLNSVSIKSILVKVNLSEMGKWQFEAVIIVESVKITGSNWSRGRASNRLPCSASAALYTDCLLAITLRLWLCRLRYGDPLEHRADQTDIGFIMKYRYCYRGA